MSIVPPYRWKLVYEDETEFTDLDGEPWESPPLGVIICLQPGPYEDMIHGEMVQGGMLRGKWAVLYRRDAGRWMPVDEFGLIDQTMRHGWEGLVCRPGVTMPDRGEFKAIWQPYLDEVRGRGDG